MKAAGLRLPKEHQQIKTLGALLGKHLSESPAEAGHVNAALKTAVKLRLLLELYMLREERLLRVLEDHLETGRGSLSVLSEEQKFILSTLDGVIAALQRSTNYTVKAGKTPKMLDKRLLETLSEHLSKVENVVYWLAELRLNDAEKRALAIESFAAPKRSTPHNEPTSVNSA